MIGRVRPQERVKCGVRRKGKSEKKGRKGGGGEKKKFKKEKHGVTGVM